MISLVQPPPPPPPKEEPPPPEVKEEVKIDEPEQQPDEPPEQSADDAPPPGEDLGVDADGGAGGDAFRLIGRKGGRDLLGSGGGSEYAWYANALQQDIADLLSDNNKIRQSRYIIEVQLWFEQNGKVKKAKLTKSSGDAAMDKSIQLALNEMGSLREKPPEGIPQPVRLRIESRL
jgi:protein TonB